MQFYTNKNCCWLYLVVSYYILLLLIIYCYILLCLAACYDNLLYPVIISTSQCQAQKCIHLRHFFLSLDLLNQFCGIQHILQRFIRTDLIINLSSQSGHGIFLSSAWTENDCHIFYIHNSRLFGAVWYIIHNFRFLLFYFIFILFFSACFQTDIFRFLCVRSGISVLHLTAEFKQNFA